MIFENWRAMENSHVCCKPWPGTVHNVAAGEEICRSQLVFGSYHLSVAVQEPASLQQCSHTIMKLLTNRRVASSVSLWLLLWHKSHKELNVRQKKRTCWTVQNSVYFIPVQRTLTLLSQSILKTLTFLDSFASLKTLTFLDFHIFKDTFLDSFISSKTISEQDSF